MSFFDGSYKKRRNINLGGARQQELDREQLLRKSQEERKARELERLRLRCATRIQAFFRGRSDVRRRRSQERKVFEQDLQRLDFGSAASLEISQLLTSLCRKLLFLNGGSLDCTLVEQLAAKLLLTVRLGEDVVYAAIVPYIEPEYRQIWSHQLKKLVLLLTSNIPKRPRMAADSDSVNPELRLLNLLFGAKNYVNRRLLSSDTDPPVICRQLAMHLVRHDFYRKIGGFFELLGPEDRYLPNISECVALSIHVWRILETGSDEAVLAVDSIILFVFTVPYLPNRMNTEAFTVLFAHLPFDAVVVRLSSSPDILSSLTHVQSVSLLANIIALGKPKVAKMSSNVLVAYLRSLTVVMNRIPPGMLPGTALNEEDDEDDDEDDLQPSKACYPLLDPKVENALSMVYDPAHLRSTFVFRGSQYDSPMLAALSTFLSTLLSRWSSRRVEILNGVSQAGERDLLLACWHALRHTHLHYDILEVKSAAAVLSDPKNAGDWSILALLSDVYSRLLLTMGDDEFFSDKNAFTVEDLIALSAVLRNVTFALWWSDALSGKQSDTTIGLHVRATATKLLQQLHMRDARRPFCPEDHWIMTKYFDLSSFLASVAEEAEKFMEEELETGRQVLIESANLNVLHHIPFTIPFEDRVLIFRHFVHNDRARTQEMRLQGRRFDSFSPVARVNIRRDHVFEDGYTSLSGLGRTLKHRIAISFIDEYGMHEAGIDGGGVFKEFLTALLKVALDTNYGIFTSTPDQLLYPNPHSYAKEEQQLDHFRFLGLVLGKALYEGILVDAAFAPFFLNKWLGRLNYLDDLPSLDKDLYNGLIYLKNYTGDTEDLALNFTTTSSDFGSTNVIELISDGANVPVMNCNKIRYIYLIANYRLNVQIDQQCRAFFSGLAELINPKWLRMFNQLELHVLLSGSQRPIDVEDLRANVVYSGGYDEDHPVIHNFWAVVRSMSDEERRRLLKFVTSVERPPLLGFREMKPLFTIHNARGIDDDGGARERLPTSSTCVNLLKLPPYADQTTMREKIVYAINSGAGFDLS